MPNQPGPSTLSVHGSGRDGLRPLSTPVVRATAHPRDGRWLYSRFSNPTIEAVAVRVAALERAPSATLVSSGTAAITCALLATTPPGGTIVCPRELCGDALHLLTGHLPGLGRRVAFVDLDDLAGWRRALTAPGSAAAYVETISNPGLRIADIPALADVTGAAGAVLVVDATLSTPINQRPLEQGCDLVVHSAGKYLNGHGDLIAGTVAGDTRRVAAVREVAQRLGASADPAAASLLERGLKTLALRMERHARTASLVARRLESSPDVASVRYPWLASHPDARRARRLLTGGSGVVTFVLGGGDEAAHRFAPALRLIRRAPTLGAAESLIWMPGIDGHPSDPDAGAVTPGLVRLSVGLEDASDIVADLERGLESARDPAEVVGAA